MPISLKQIPVSRAPFVFGFLSALTSNLSASPSARNGIADRAELRFEFAQQPEFFVCLSRRGDDGH